MTHLNPDSVLRISDVHPEAQTQGHVSGSLCCGSQHVRKAKGFRMRADQQKGTPGRAKAEPRPAWNWGGCTSDTCVWLKTEGSFVLIMNYKGYYYLQEGTRGNSLTPTLAVNAFPWASCCSPDETAKPLRWLIMPALIPWVRLP